VGFRRENQHRFVRTGKIENTQTDVVKYGLSLVGRIARRFSR
jgi:hypothetical protein